MDNSVPCSHLPPLIPADSTVAPSLIDKLSLHSGRRRRRSSPTDTATGIGGNSSSSSDACLGETGTCSNDGQDLSKRDHFCSLLWHAQQKQQQQDDVVVMRPEGGHCFQSQHTNPNLQVNKEKINDNRCWLVEEKSLSQPENLLPTQTGSEGETPSSVQSTSVSNSCCSSMSSGTNGVSSAELSPLTGSGEDIENDGCGNVDDGEHLSSSSVLFVYSPQSCPANLVSASLTTTNNTICTNNLQVARPKDLSRSPVSCNTSHHHHHCHQWRLNPHRHSYVQDYSRPQQVNIPVESQYSLLDDSNQNSLSSVPSRNNALSVSPSSSRDAQHYQMKMP